MNHSPLKSAIAIHYFCREVGEGDRKSSTIKYIAMTMGDALVVQKTFLRSYLIFYSDIFASRNRLLAGL